jgi:hypothetical protein
MNKKPRTWLGRGAVWVWLVFASALVLASACTDTQAPRYVPDPEDSIPEDTTEVGFLILPGIQDEASV